MVASSSGGAKLVFFFFLGVNDPFVKCVAMEVICWFVAEVLCLDQIAGKNDARLMWYYCLDTQVCLVVYLNIIMNHNNKLIIFSNTCYHNNK